MKIDGLPRKFEILCVRGIHAERFLRAKGKDVLVRRAGDFNVYIESRGLRAKGEAEVTLTCDNQGGIPVPTTIVMFDFDGDGTVEESKLVSVKTNSGSIAALIVERYWRFSCGPDRSYTLYTDLPTAIAEFKNLRSRKTSYRRSEEWLRWSDAHPAYTREEFERQNEVRRTHKYPPADYASPPRWQQMQSHMSFVADPLILGRHLRLEKELNEKS